MSDSAACGNERPHAAHSWHGIAKLEVGTKYGDDWQCPGVSAAQVLRKALSDLADSATRGVTGHAKGLAEEMAIITSRGRVVNAALRLR